jgi:UDP:flavonoid glycosyltransferase YjiC (YdhE family)
MGTNILVSVYGSAGDLFPLVPVVLRLRDAGHDVRCAVPRALGLYMRPLGIPVFPLGHGREMTALDDGAIVTTRFGGWDSVRRLVQSYVRPSLVSDVAAVEDVITSWRPDLVVCSTFATATRIAAYRAAIDQVDVSIYPSVLTRVRHARAFARGYRALCSDLARLPPGQVDSDLAGQLAWGISQDPIILHDPKLVARTALEGRAVGFPYWDAALRRREEVASVERWFDRSCTTSLVVTIGSYLGIRRLEQWREVAGAVAALDVRAVFLGPRRELRNMLERVDGDCIAAGFIPLSSIAGRADAIVHHGGIGTMFAALHAGTPAIVSPRAFDQPLNAQLVEELGAGLAAKPGNVRSTLEKLLAHHDDHAHAARAASDTLVPSETATDRAAERILARM